MKPPPRTGAGLLAMTRSALRIRHYIGTIVAVCSLGGLLLSFELAFLFQSFERRSAELRSDSSMLSSVVALEGRIEEWLQTVRASLGDAEGTRAVEVSLKELLIRLAQQQDPPEAAAIRPPLAQIVAELQDALEGPKMALRTKPGTVYFENDRAEVLKKLQAKEANIEAGFQHIEAIIGAKLRQAADELALRREELYRTAGLLTAGYALLVLFVWRWVVARFLRPLQSLTREARRTFDGEAAFKLRPDGPHEVRVLTESVSTLVGNLMGAREHLEEKVKERTLELERANRAKNEFLANMSHEIRTPMTAILGYAELCLALDIPETDRRRYAEVIHANGEHLLSVINDILDVSKIEAGRMTVEPTVCSPFEVVSEVRALMEVRAREKGLALWVENVGPIPEVVRTDPTRLRQILLNLLNNAIKFTDQGEVKLSFHMQPREGATDQGVTEPGEQGVPDPRVPEQLVFEVRDTGVGLSPEQVGRIFLPFVQGDTSTTRKYGGSGLGLTISRTLARLLGGDLTCQSELGRGSSFCVAIDPGPLEGVRRLEQAPEAVRSTPTRLPIAGPGPDLRGTVLLAEDVAVNRRLISTILLRAGIRVEEAENGRIALEKALAARDAGQGFDILFMDMQMPEMDGYEATRRLRQAGYLRPIVALTSHSMSGERQRCLEAGCDEYMTKPIDRLLLLQVLSRFLPSDQAEQHQAA